MNTLIASRERNKENDLVFAVLSYASRCVAEGDIHAFRDIGFQVEDIGIIERLSLADLQTLSTSRSHAINVRLDREAWGWLLKRMRRQRSRDALALALIQLDAPKAMMASLFGYNDRDYSTRRETYGIQDTIVGGRPPSASEAEERRLWDLWVRLAKPEAPHQLSSDDCWRALKIDQSGMRRGTGVFTAKSVSTGNTFRLHEPRTGAPSFQLRLRQRASDDGRPSITRFRFVASYSQ